MFDKAKRLEKKKKKKEKDLTAERNERCLPAAREIQQIIAKGRIDDKSANEMFEDYSPLVREVMDVFMANGVKMGEIEYVFKLALMSHDILKETVHQSIDKHLSTVEEKFWGKPGTEVTISDLDKHLKGSE